MGRPRPVRLVELGPGHGTLMADAVRALKVIPDFRAAIAVHLVELSEPLRRAQRRALSGVDATWHQRFDEVPDGPALVIANELFDALPIHQFQRTAAGWCERCVGLEADGSAFRFVLSPAPVAGLVAAGLADAPLDSVSEICPSGRALAADIGARVASFGGAALILDYGAAKGSTAGVSLQAVRRHRGHDALAKPGEADLSARVDFAALAEAGAQAGAAVYGPLEQGRFLSALGIAERLATLVEGRAAAECAALSSGVERLTDPAQMGSLFKVLAIAPPRPADARRLRVPAMIVCDALGVLPGIDHAFFTREGGVSEGIYASLNCGLGSADSPTHVAANRARALAALGQRPENLRTPIQSHSIRVVVLDGPSADGPAARGGCAGHDDAGARRLGILTADCAPVLLADAGAGVIGAVHAGWRGALDGVLEAAVEAMTAAGADPGRTAAAIGPCIAVASYEVGPEFAAPFLAADAGNADLFAAAPGWTPALRSRRFHRPPAGGVRHQGVLRESPPIPAPMPAASSAIAAPEGGAIPIMGGSSRRSRCAASAPGRGHALSPHLRRHALGRPAGDLRHLLSRVSVYRF